MAKILDGKIVRDKIAVDLKTQIANLKSKPKLVIIQIGDLPESNTYISQKVKFGEKIGAIVEHKKFPENIGQEELIAQISELNTDPVVHGVIVQMPIPESLDKDAIIDSIDPKKDVDGLTSHNIKLLFEGTNFEAQPQGLKGYTPATTKGILTLLDYYKIPVTGKHIVIVGRSSLVGKPTALALLNRDASVTVCHSKTRNILEITKTADILIAAVGKPKLVTRDYVSKDQVVVDVGINVVDQLPVTRDQKPEDEPPARKLVGDVDFDEVSKIVSAISPVPGGVGPMTVASLFQNLLEAYTRQA